MENCAWQAPVLQDMDQAPVLQLFTNNVVRQPTNTDTAQCGVFEYREIVRHIAGLQRDGLLLASRPIEVQHAAPISASERYGRHGFQILGHARCAALRQQVGASHK